MLTHAQLCEFEDHGYLLLPALFSENEPDAVRLVYGVRRFN